MKKVTDISQFKKGREPKKVDSFGKVKTKPERVTPSGVKITLKDQPEPPEPPKAA